MPLRAGARKAAFDFDLAETAVKRAGLRCLPGPHRATLANDQPDFAIALRHGRIGRGGHGLAARMRMIMAHNPGPAGACGLVRAEQRHRGDLEAMARICRDIRGRQDRVDAHRSPIAEQQPAAFMAAGGFRLALDRVGESP